MACRLGVLLGPPIEKTGGPMTFRQVIAGALQRRQCPLEAPFVTPVDKVPLGEAGPRLIEFGGGEIALGR